MADFMATVDARAFPKYNPNTIRCCATVKAGVASGFKCLRSALSDGVLCHVHNVLLSLLTTQPITKSTTTTRTRRVRFYDDKESDQSDPAYGPVKRERFWSKRGAVLV